jgi:hypothetical protein
VHAGVALRQRGPDILLGRGVDLGPTELRAFRHSARKAGADTFLNHGALELDEGRGRPLPQERGSTGIAIDDSTIRRRAGGGSAAPRNICCVLLQVT